MFDPVLFGIAGVALAGTIVGGATGYVLWTRRTRGVFQSALSGAVFGALWMLAVTLIFLLTLIVAMNWFADVLRAETLSVLAVFSTSMAITGGIIGASVGLLLCSWPARSPTSGVVRGALLATPLILLVVVLTFEPLVFVLGPFIDGVENLFASADKRKRDDTIAAILDTPVSDISNDIRHRAVNVIADALGVETSAVTDQATLSEDLGAEDKENWTLTLRIEEEFGCWMPDGALQNSAIVRDVLKFALWCSYQPDELLRVNYEGCEVERHRSEFPTIVDMCGYMVILEVTKTSISVTPIIKIPE